MAIVVPVLAPFFSFSFLTFLFYFLTCLFQVVAMFASLVVFLVHTSLQLFVTFICLVSWLSWCPHEPHFLLFFFFSFFYLLGLSIPFSACFFSHVAAVFVFLVVLWSTLLSGRAPCITALVVPTRTLLVSLIFSRQVLVLQTTFYFHFVFIYTYFYTWRWYSPSSWCFTFILFDFSLVDFSFSLV